jgi:alpha-L-fucosidase
VHDEAWKSNETLIRNLIDIVSKGGNYLLNIGPKSDGSIPQESIDSMRAIGKWMATNSEAIYETTASPFEQPAWGRYTKKPGRLYAHVFDWPADSRLVIPLRNAQVKKAYMLADEGKRSLAVRAGADNLLIRLPAQAPDPFASVVSIEYDL